MEIEIKFRAWEKGTNKMHYGIEHGIYEDPDEVIPFGIVLGFERYEVMQYIGLKDSHDTEIYDGDIVRLTERNYTDCSKEELESTETTISLVAYDYGTFGLRKKLNGTGLRPFIWLVGADYDVEVIGNIYENPELLEGEGNEYKDSRRQSK